MLSNDEHPGLFSFLLGLIVVAFAGIGLSMAVDRRFSFSSSVSALEADVKNNELELDRLKIVHHESSWRLSELEAKSKTAGSTLASFKKSAADLERRRKILLSEAASLKASIPVLKEEFARYRLKFREAARDAAVGESLGTLTTLGGREYGGAFITRVTDVGLEIRHEHGTARISATDLAPAFQSRFQWDDKERQARLDEEFAVHKAMERIPETPLPNRGEIRPDIQKVQMLRGKVIAWKSKISQLHSERSRALSSSYGSQASPPGSLETWQARAARLGAEIARAEAELAAAKAALALVSPGDELLKPPYTGGR